MCAGSQVCCTSFIHGCRHPELDSRVVLAMSVPGNCPPLLSRHACSQLMSVGSQHRLRQAQCHFHLRLSWQLGSSWTDVLPLCTPALKHVDVSDIFLSGKDQRGISCFSVGSACRPSCTDMPRNKSCKPSLLTAVRTISSSSPVDLTERDQDSASREINMLYGPNRWPQKTAGVLMVIWDQQWQVSSNKTCINLNCSKSKTRICAEQWIKASPLSLTASMQTSLSLDRPGVGVKK